MEYGSSIISLLFFIGFAIYIFWGIYVIRINPKAGVNRAFLGLSISLAMWSFGYGMTISSGDLKTALFWIRFSSIGKILLFTIVLHFMLLLANRDLSPRQKKLFILIYIPALINIYIFALSNSMAASQYNLIKTAYGWTNRPVNNIWSFLYYFYYILYVVSSLIIVGKWKREFKCGSITRQGDFLFITFIGALLVGTFTDIVLASIFKIYIVQSGPLFALLPVWAIYHSARYYNILNIERLEKEEIIISSQQQKKIFTNLSIGISISGILAFISEYFSDISDASGDLKIASIKAGLLISLGLTIYSIQKIKRESLKELLTTIVLVSSIPIVLFQFLNYSTITVWVFPVIIIISSLLFTKGTLLISTTVVAIITQRLVWILRPESYILVDKYDFILRIIVYILVFFLGSYVNKTYMGKIKENEYQIKLQEMVSDVSFEFLSLNQENFHGKINNLLRDIGSFFNVDRTYLFTIDHKNGTMTYSNEWCNTGIGPEVGTIEDMSLDVFPWWINQLEKNNLVYIKDVDLMPREARAEQEQLQRQGVKSLISTPIVVDGEIEAFIGIDSVMAIKEWSGENIELLNIMSNILSSGITQIKADKEIEFMAYYDSLTKIPNRFLFEKMVNRSIEESRGRGSFISIIFIDLDNFKSVNDTIGHKGGDILLEQVAQGLVGILGKTHMVARFGGDEFMIMIRDIRDHNIITKKADRIMKLFSQPFTVNGQEFLITASAGISIYPVDGRDSDSLVKNADIAMYKAKSKGKNQYALCTREFKDEIQMNGELSNDLYGALERNEFMVYYQPQIDPMTKKIKGVEALLRWIHPTRGIISPGIFIPLAEKNSLINSIGEWVLRTACLQNKKWQDMGLAYMDMAVNLSAVQIINPNIAEEIESILEETGLDPKYLQLEITEGIAIKETNYVIDVLDKLKKIGVSIAIDDFGTGYSSLSRLKLLPIDRIKIDMQFIHGIERNGKDKAITMGIINLGKSLGLNVLAEGVETEEQLEFLIQKSCDYVQGYYYYKPMSGEELEGLLEDLQ